MRRFVFGLLAGSVLALPFCTVAQDRPAPADTVAAQVQLLGADCAVFSAAARLPRWLPAQKLAALHRFTPATAQIVIAEQALTTVQLLHVNPGSKTSQDSIYARNITQRLGHYHRQYFGFYNRRQQPCVFINLIGNVAFTGGEVGLRPKPPGYVPYWLRSYVFMEDGGDDHWSICYNLTTGEFYQYWHNLDLGGG